MSTLSAPAAEPPYSSYKDCFHAERLKRMDRTQRPMGISEATISARDACHQYKQPPAASKPLLFPDNLPSADPPLYEQERRRQAERAHEIERLDRERIQYRDAYLKRLREHAAH